MMESRPRRTDRPVKRTMTACGAKRNLRRPCERGTHNHRRSLEQKALATAPKREATAYGPRAVCALRTRRGRREIMHYKVLG